jgi:hypothetical protein
MHQVDLVYEAGPDQRMPLMKDAHREMVTTVADGRISGTGDGFPIPRKCAPQRKVLLLTFRGNHKDM